MTLLQRSELCSLTGKSELMSATAIGGSGMTAIRKQPWEFCHFCDPKVGVGSWPQEHRLGSSPEEQVFLHVTNQHEI